MKFKMQTAELKMKQCYCVVCLERASKDCIATYDAWSAYMIRIYIINDYMNYKYDNH